VQSGTFFASTKRSVWRFRAMALLTGLCTNICVAQDIPNPNSELQRQEEQRLLRQQRQESTPSIRLQSATTGQAVRLPEETPCLVIDRVRITGMQISALDTALLGLDQDDSPIGKCLGSKGIQILLDRVQNKLIDRGYITSRVQAPSQDLNTGELILAAEPGLIGKILSSPDAPNTKWPKNSLATSSGATLDLRDVEQSLENLRRNSSAEANLEIVPSSAPGYSDIFVRFQQSRPLLLNLSLDDSGTKTTGRWQGNASVTWDNPLGLSDQIYLSLGTDLAERDPGPRGTDSQVLQYSVPFGYWLLSFSTSYNKYHQTIVGAFQSYLYSGASDTSEVQVNRVIYRSAIAKTTASLKAIARHSRNYIDDTEVEVQRRGTGGWEIGLLHTYYLEQGSLSGSINYRRGTGAFAAIAAPEEAFGEGTSRMRLTQANLTLQRPLRLAGIRAQYNGQLRAQWNHTPLTGQDHMCIGGRHTIRGFDGLQSLCGERGRFVRNDLQTAWDSSAIQMYVGLDVGRVGGINTPVDSLLSGAVVGLRGAFAMGLSSTTQMDIFVGGPLRKPDQFTTATTTAGLSLNVSF